MRGDSSGHSVCFLFCVYSLQMVDLNFFLAEADCSGKFLKYFARLYILLCLYVIEHSFIYI